jgi:hypothetical protein
VQQIGAEHGEGFTTFRPSGQALRVDVDFLNEKMRKRGRHRMRFQVRPDEAFGLVYSWDGVLADTRPSHTETWRRLAQEEGRPVPEYSRPVHSIPPERVITQVREGGGQALEGRDIQAALAQLWHGGLKGCRILDVATAFEGDNRQSDGVGLRQKTVMRE